MTGGVFNGTAGFTLAIKCPSPPAPPPPLCVVFFLVITASDAFQMMQMVPECVTRAGLMHLTHREGMCNTPQHHPHGISVCMTGWVFIYFLKQQKKFAA